jgi:hypothetical protein
LQPKILLTRNSRGLIVRSYDAANAEWIEVEFDVGFLGGPCEGGLHCIEPVIAKVGNNSDVKGLC